MVVVATRVITGVMATTDNPTSLPLGLLGYHAYEGHDGYVAIVSLVVVVAVRATTLILALLWLLTAQHDSPHIAVECTATP